MEAGKRVIEGEEGGKRGMEGGKEGRRKGVVFVGMSKSLREKFVTAEGARQQRHERGLFLPNFQLFMTAARGVFLAAGLVLRRQADAERRGLGDRHENI